MTINSALSQAYHLSRSQRGESMIVVKQDGRRYYVLPASEKDDLRENEELIVTVAAERL